MHSSHDRLNMRTSHMVLLAALALLVLLFIFFFSTSRSTFVSSEVSFTDTSAGGMQIVPASCPSAPPTDAGSGALAYRLNPGDTGRDVDAYGYHYCLANSSGNTYFVPARSLLEFQEFYRVIEFGYGGMAPTDPPLYH